MNNSDNVFIFETKNVPIDTISNKINKFLDIFSDNAYISTFIILFFISYGGFIGTGGKPPKFIIDLFSNPIARILLLSIVAYQVNHDIQISLVMAVAFFNCSKDSCLNIYCCVKKYATAITNDI